LPDAPIADELLSDDEFGTVATDGVDLVGTL
jgi:hypothetical protein